MDIAFLGGVFPADELADILKKSKGPVQIAANCLQWNIINGLDVANQQPLTLINAPFVSSYPQYYSDMILRSRAFSHTPGANDRSIGFINIFGIKHIIKTIFLTKEALKWSRSRKQCKGNGNKKAVIVYSLHSPLLVAAIIAKMFHPKLHVNIVVPDLPEFMGDMTHEPLVKRVLKYLDQNFIYTLIGKADSFTVLTQAMTEKLKVGRRPFVVVEGMVDLEEKSKERLEDSLQQSQKIILYTGTLDKRYGILDLLDAFRLIDDPECRLYICGEGNARDVLQERARQDERIKWFGTVNHQEALELQRNATLLVNPRNDEGEFTQYSFPSKTMEYLLSGTPTMVHKLPGIPDEYYHYLYTFSKKEVTAMAEDIQKVLSLPNEQRQERGRQSRNFVLERKNHRVQSEKIYRMIEESFKKD